MAILPLSNSKFLSIGILLLVSSCSTNTIKEDNDYDLSFSNLNFTQNDSTGLKSWNLSSPKARFDTNSSLVSASTPKIVLYKGSLVEYNITSQELSSFNNFENISLIGDVTIRQILGPKLTITGDSLKWNPKESELQIDQNPKVSTDKLVIDGQLLYFNPKSKEVSFKGSTSYKFQPNVNSDNGMFFRSEDIKWNISTGDLASNSNVTGFNTSNNKSGTYRFEAKSLEGNSIQNYIKLKDCNFEQKKLVRTKADICILGASEYQQKSYTSTSTQVNFLDITTPLVPSQYINFVSDINQVETLLEIEGLDQSLDKFR